jgi:hypothetical protein
MRILVKKKDNFYKSYGLRVVRHGVSQIRKAITDFDSSPLNPAAA